MERQANRRFTGSRARVAEAALFVAGLTAACQPTGAVETQQPTIVPTESPVPSLMTTVPSESPSSSPIVSASPEATATPESTFPTPKEFYTTVLESQNPLKSVNDLTTATEALYAKYPSLEQDVALKVILKGINNCFNSKDNATQLAGCSSITGFYYNDFPSLTNYDPEVLQTAGEFAQRALAKVPNFKEQFAADFNH